MESGGGGGGEVSRRGAPYYSYPVTGNYIRYKCLEMPLSSILIVSETGPMTGGLSAVFHFVLAVFLIKLISEAIPSAGNESISVLFFKSRFSTADHYWVRATSQFSN